jgi:putative transposase
VVPHCVRSDFFDPPMPDQLKIRKTIRLPQLAYTEHGAYFLTLVTDQRRLLFGEIVDGDIKRNTLGDIIQEEWMNSVEIRPHLLLDQFAVMPNHLHGVVGLTSSVPNAQSARSAALRTSRDRAPASISSFVAGFKAATTRRIREYLRDPQFRVWQPRFYDHVIRGERDYQEIRTYIFNNPMQWQFDRENPDHS